MTFKSYIDGLNQFATENPESLTLDVLTSGDDEGNSYNHVYYAASMVEYDGECIDDESDEPNAVLVN